jgi:hypothetical protein
MAAIDAELPGMSVEAQIEAYLAEMPEPKRGEMRDLHRIILGIAPECRLWFLDGKNDAGKIISNPNIGYDFLTMPYANGTSREFYRIGISANTSGISLYVMGIEDKKYLSATWGDRIGKASVTGYCIKFKSMNDINMEVLEEIIGFGFGPR